MKEYIKKLTLIWIAMIIGQLMFAGVILFIKSQNIVEINEELNKTFLMIIPIIAIVFVGASILVYKNKINSIKKDKNTENQKNKYLAATIISFALLEIPSILGLISYLLTKNMMYFYFFIFIIFMFFISKPSETKFNLDLEIKEEE